MNIAQWSFNDAIRLISRMDAFEINITFEIDARYSSEVYDALNFAGCEVDFIY